MGQAKIGKVDPLGLFLNYSDFAHSTELSR